MSGRDDEAAKGGASDQGREPEASGERARTGDGAERPPPSHGGYRDYVIKGEQGRGGLGRVLRAHDRRLDRPVAIKEILASEGDASDTASRFLREARLTAQLQHPSIVPVYEIGFRDDGAPFYAMKLIAGESFDVVIARTRSLDERLALLPNVLAVADAIAYAHDRHIIHRDLKPSNVIIGAFGETVVIDWGIAKDLGAGAPAGTSTRPEPIGGVPANARADVSASAALSDTLLALGDTSGAKTHAGRALGTLGYMPPEQFRGEEVDERTDVFALGAFLYHTVTGVAPYEADARAALFDRIARGVTRPIESREPAVPLDLAAIARKAMAPAPADRYASAKELAADLKRFQTGQLVSAHAYSRRVLLGRWLGRHRRVVAMGAGFVLALGVLGVVSVRGIVHERDRVDVARGLAEARAQALTLVQARSSLDRDPTASVAWLKTASFDDASRSEALSIAADARARGVARLVLHPTGLGELTRAVLSLDGTHLYAGPEQPGLVEWDLAHGDRVRLLSTPITLLDVAPTSDGAHLFAGSLEGGLLDLDLATGAMRVLSGHQGKATARAAPLGRVVASCGVDGSVRTWNLDTGEGRLLGSHEGSCAGVSFSPDARSLASVGDDDRLRVWDLRTGSDRTIPAGKELGAVAWSPTGKTILVGGEGWRALDVATGAWRTVSGAEDIGSVGATGFLPGTETWVGGSASGAIHVFDLASGAHRALRGHATSVQRLEPRSASTFVSCADDEATRVWDLRTDTARVLRGHSGLKDCQISHDGRTILTSGNDGMVRLWDLPDEANERVLAGHIGDVYGVAFSPDGKRVATGSDDRVVRVWDVASGESIALEGHTDVVEGVAFIDAVHLASVGDDGALRVWDLTDRSSFVLPHTMRVLKVIPTRDGALVTNSTDGLVRVWDVARREPRVLRGHTAATDFVALSPDEERIVSGSDDGTVRVWDRRSGAQLVAIDALTKRITGVAFAAGATVVASSGGDGAVRLWDAQTGALRRTMTGHTDRIRSLSVSPDGRRLVTASNDRTARIWDVGTGASIVLAGHTGEIRRAEFSPDGRWVVTSSYDKTTRLWDARTGFLLMLARSDAPVMRSAFSPDGTLVASVGFDRMLRLVRIDPARFIPSEAAPFRAWLAVMTSAVVRGAGPVESP